ncbi:MAG: apolipoprotein N-acyltransferase [Rhodocyclales bacterium]|nr:apolipoprotein N-acyltransferase [Rhodocyclales bacterium]
MRRLPYLAFLSGAATVAGFAPLEWFPLPLLTLAWLFHAWRQAPTALVAARIGYFWGLGCFLAGVSWIYVSLHEFGAMAMPLAALATLLFCAFLALFPALAGFAFRRAQSGGSGCDALLAAGLWTTAEWARGWVFTGFPWLSLGYSQTPPSPLAGYAQVLGVYGISFVLALMAAWLVFDPKRLRGVLVLAVLGGGGLLLRDVSWVKPVGAPVTISLLQGNIPQSIKWDPRRAVLSLETYVRLARSHPAALTVLPETALPLFFDEVPRELLTDLTRHGAVLIGVPVRTREDGRISGYTNSAVVVSRAGGDFEVAAYAKRHLVPFGEYVPPGFAWFFGLVNIPLADFTAGPVRQKPLAVAGQLLAPNICYEDLFGEEIIQALPAATVLVNLSNTAWFGDSLAQPQHLQISRMRALETGRPMLRATNTGMTAAIAPNGAVTAMLKPFSTGALVVAVQGYAGATPFVRHGNAGAMLMVLLACLPALMWRRKA